MAEGVTISAASARRKWMHDDAHWALFCLHTAPSHEIEGHPLRGTVELLRAGWARVDRHYVDDSYKIRVIVITAAGRAELIRASKDI